MSVLIFHTSTAPFVQQPARALYEAGLLDRFYTTIHEQPDSQVQKLAAAIARLAGFDLPRRLRRRAVTEIPAKFIHSFPLREWIRLLSGALDRSGRLTDLVWEWAEPGFDRRVARELHRGLQGVYGFEYSSLATFQAARERGLKIFYDVPAPEPRFVQALLNREVAAHPVLATAYHAHTEKREERRIARRNSEWRSADRVIAASHFTRRTYEAAGFDGANIRVVPYGAPPPADRDWALSGGSTDQTLRLLWAGTFSIRKGAHYLLEAWKREKFGRHARLRIHGSIALPDSLVRPLPEGIEIAGPISRDQLMEVYRESDLLIFPTLCDGFGMVATEAWSRGLPVLTTAHAGAADLLQNERNGLLVESANAHALVESIIWCLEHRAELHAMREESLATAARWQWADYRRALIDAVRPTLGLTA